MSRRAFVAGAVGGAASTCLISGGTASAADHDGEARRRRRRPQPVPTAVPGGFELAPGNVIHVFGPGDPSVTLPFTGATLEGFDVEPGTIADFRGRTAVAFHVGTARGSDGRTYNLETDLRMIEGHYVVDGEEHWGQFAFV